MLALAADAGPFVALGGQDVGVAGVASASTSFLVVPKLRVSAARRDGSLSDGTRIVATMPLSANVDAAHPVPVPWLVGHLFHVPRLFLPDWLNLRGGSARGTGGTRALDRG